MKYFLAVLLFFGLTSVKSAEQDRVGNGGGYWGCITNGTLTKGELVDFYEAKRRGFVLLNPTSNDYLEIVNERAKFLENSIPDVYAMVSPHITEVLNRFYFIDADFTRQDDSLYTWLPKAIDCAGGNWEYMQLANFNDVLRRVEVNNPLWTDSKVTTLDKAGLVWHEVIYRWLRKKKGDLNSTRARHITGVIFSTLTPNQIRSEILTLMSNDPEPTPTPTPTPVPTPVPDEKWFCVAKNNSTQVLYHAYAAIKVEAETKVLDDCARGPQGSSCGHYSECTEITDTTPKFFCVVENHTTRRQFFSRTRTELEGEYFSKKECKAAESPQSCSAIVTCTPLD